MDEAHATGHDSVSPKQLALTYDRVISAHWRGETGAVTAFGTWFESHWSDQAPPEPDEPPEGTSILGGAGSGIRWYARDELVLGYVSRRPSGCYRVQVSEAVPSLEASADPVARRVDADHVLHHASAGPVKVPATSGQREPPTSQSSRQDAVSDEPDLRAPVRPESTKRHAADGDGSVVQEPATTEMLVAVDLLERTASPESC